MIGNSGSEPIGAEILLLSPSRALGCFPGRGGAKRGAGGQNRQRGGGAIEELG